ncbi:hypothetical protein [Fimbriimonas ginsengisoli]|uniref:Uncharacterized protein n=1 Tax=Fimbriimonas ginsengisoli Gsoil 348 TaxID=661478 RepID=A0A068NXD4_FIMGI|nr:hypothetical protein [Fimbriimonas ginsengisoli]AIE88002.1 hypothetical protein OP10G_4634 [Fimbriimonas ginsengisoli Gsoil 348]
MSVPFGAMATIAPNLLVVKKSHEKPAEPSRALTSAEMITLRGRTGESPYLVGQNKWDIVYKGLNLMSGNYSVSATDLSSTERTASAQLMIRTKIVEPCH